MAVAESTGTLSMAASKELGQRLGDSPKVRDLRAAGAAITSIAAMPDSYKERPWKYLNVSRLDLSRYAPALDAVSSGAGEGRRSCPVTGEHAAVIAFENSETVFTEDSPEGLTVVPFEAAGALQSIIDERLGSAVPAPRSKFTALHYAFLRGGVLVHVAANAEITLPVRIVRNLVSGDQLAAPHTLIVTGANSSVTVIEEFLSGEDDIVALPTIEVLPGPGSRVRYTAIHRWGSKTRVFLEQRMISERDSEFTGLHLVLGGKVVKGHLESSLVGRGSASELYALGAGLGQEHADFYTLQDHIGPDTRSDLLFKSALRDESRAVYYGLTRVGLGAKNADANQENRNLILSDKAKADSDPVLEILTSNIIRCSHGATAGPVDDEQLYYLETRGIPHAAAEALLVRAFLGQVLDRVPDEAVRDELAAILDARLG